MQLADRAFETRDQIHAGKAHTLVKANHIPLHRTRDLGVCRDGERLFLAVGSGAKVAP